MEEPNADDPEGIQRFIRYNESWFRRQVNEGSSDPTPWNPFQRGAPEADSGNLFSDFSDSDDVNMTPGMRRNAISTWAMVARLIWMRNRNDRSDDVVQKGVEMFGPIFHRIKFISLQIEEIKGSEEAQELVF